MSQVKSQFMFSIGNQFHDLFILAKRYRRKFVVADITNTQSIAIISLINASIEISSLSKLITCW